MSMIAKFGLANSPLMPALNTGTLLDLAFGKFDRGSKGEWLLNGGIEPMTAISGKSGQFKSTTIDSLIALLLKIYPMVEVLKYDTEQNAFGIDRFVMLANGDVSVADRVVVQNKSDTDGTKFVETIESMGKERILMKNKQSNLYTTPFLMDGKPLKMLIPFIVDIDSFTLMSFPSVDALLEDNDLGSSKTNMYYVQEGNIKTKLINTWTKLAHQAHMYFIFTAQLDEDIQLDPRKHATKQMQFMRVGDKMKRLGAQFEFLTNVLFQSHSCTVLQDANRECQYPVGSGSSDGELSTLTIRVLRCKKNAAGTDIPLVTSQNYGILSDLTNYHYLRTSKWGTLGSDRSPRSAFHPDLGLPRKEVRDKLSGNYELTRGIEILAQMKFIASTWSNIPYRIPDTAEEFVEQIHKNTSIKVNDILNSRSHWTYDPKEKRPYMSIMDIMHLLNKK